MQVVNWRMIQHPVNWIIILFMLIIASIAGHLLLSLFGHEPDNNTTNNQYQSKQTA